MVTFCSFYDVIDPQKDLNRLYKILSFSFDQLKCSIKRIGDQHFTSYAHSEYIITNVHLSILKAQTIERGLFLAPILTNEPCPKRFCRYYQS